MNGKELIIYILEHNLENKSVEDILDEAFASPTMLAAKFSGVGEATVRGWYNLELIKGFTIGGKLYLDANAKDPRPSKEKRK